MIRPSPESNSIITQDFEDLTGRLMSFDELERLKYEGPLLFDEKDVNATQDLIMQAFRQLCFTEHVTEKYFSEKYKRYATLLLGKTPQSATNNLVNTLRNIRDVKLTWNKFSELTRFVLGLKPEVVHIVFSNVQKKTPVVISTNSSKLKEYRKKLHGDKNTSFNDQEQNNKPTEDEQPE